MLKCDRLFRTLTERFITTQYGPSNQDKEA